MKIFYYYINLKVLTLYLLIVSKFSLFKSFSFNYKLKLFVIH